MLKIVIASQNPVKINATIDAFQKMFPDEQIEKECVSVVSGVNKQPKSDSETFRGGLNRANNACKHLPNADFWVGIEGGIKEKSSEMEVFAWVVIKSRTGKIGKGKTGTFFLPAKVSELIRQGKELGEAGDIVFGRKDSKQKNGSVGILTRNVIDRKRYYTEAVILALIPFINENLY